MLVIRKEQMNILAAASGRRYEERLMDALEALFPEEAQRLSQGPEGRERLRAVVHRGFKRAERCAMENEDDIAIFVGLIMMNRQLRKDELYDEGEVLSWSRSILEQDTNPGHVKMQLVEYRFRLMAGNNPYAARICAMIDTLRETF